MNDQMTDSSKANSPMGWPPRVCDAGMLLAAIAMAYLAAGLFYGSPESRHFSVIWFFMALGFGLGMLLVRFRLLDGWTNAEWSWSEAAAVAGFGCCAAGFSYWCGMRQFGAYDQSVIIDLGWRLYNGQIPYVDFPCTVPVGFYLGAEAAFRLFGVFWSSIIKLNVLYFLLTYFWLYAVLRQVFYNRWLALVLVIACESLTLIMASYWWYNPITSIGVSVYVASVAAVLLRPGKRWLWVSLCLGLLLAALMKPNVASIAILGGTMALLLDRRTALRAVAISAVAFALLLGVLRIHGSTLTQVLQGYLSVGSRGLSSAQFLQGTNPQEWLFAWVCLAAVAPGLLHIAWRRRNGSAKPPILVLALAAIAASIFAFYGNGEAKLVDLSLGFLAMAILMGETSDRVIPLTVPPAWTAYLLLICSIFTLGSLAQAAIRDRVRTAGLGTFFEYNLDPAPLRNDFFKGVAAGHNLHIVVDALTPLCAHGDPCRIFFGPRLQWAYAAFHIPSPKGLPPWWHPGVSFSRADEAMYAQKWLDHHFTPLGLMDLSYMNPRVVNYINKSYSMDAIYPLKKYSRAEGSGPLVIMSKK